MDKGHCDQDRTHLANVTAGWQTPQLDNKALGLLASNWRLTGIVSVRSGAWLNITTGADNALNGQLQQRPNQVSDDVYGAKTLNSYLNRAAFASPAPGRSAISSTARSKGPAYWAIDTAFSRLIALGGTRNIELRLESFNLTNHFNWGNPATNLSQSQFGRITTNGGAQRIMQFGDEVRLLGSSSNDVEADLQVGLTKGTKAQAVVPFAREAPSRRTRAFCSRALLPRGPSAQRIVVLKGAQQFIVTGAPLVCPGQIASTTRSRVSEPMRWRRDSSARTNGSIEACGVLDCPDDGRSDRNNAPIVALCALDERGGRGCNFVRLIERQQGVEVRVAR